MASQNVADYLLERLGEWRVEKVFAPPSDGINGIRAAWGGADINPVFIQSRHVEMSAFGAVGYAKFSARIGVCTATSGPGAVHLLNGLHDAKLDHVPVVAIVGQTNRSTMGGSYPAGNDPQTVQGCRQREREGGHRPRTAAQPARPGDPHSLAERARRRSSSPQTCRRLTARLPPLGGR